MTTNTPRPGDIDIEAVWRLANEADRLKALNAELLAALEKHHGGDLCIGLENDCDGCTAISRAKGGA